MAVTSTHSRGAVVITGASTGIGEACARYLDTRGFRVFAGVRRDEDAARLSAGASPRFTTIHIDVTRERSIADAAAAVDAAVGAAGIAGLVNNAGIAVPSILEYQDLEALREQLEVNVVGQVAVTREFLPALRRARGRVVNMGSVAGRVSAPFIGPYSISKHALEAYSDALRVELRPWGIHVALIEPGTIATEIWRKGLDRADEMEAALPEDGRRRYGPYADAAREAMSRMGAAGIAPEAVARAVAHALESSRPKTRYLVGRDAKLGALLKRWLPDRIFDRLIVAQLGLGRRPDR